MVALPFFSLLLVPVAAGLIVAAFKGGSRSDG